MDILEKISDKYKELSETEKQVIDFILAYDDKENLKIKVIEDNLYISSSTIIRACKKMGYKSFNQFKFSLLNVSKGDDLKKNDNLTFIKKLIENDFIKTIGFLNEEILDKVVLAITCSKRIFVIGIGMSSQVTTEFNRQLKLLGFWTNDYYEKYAIERVPDIATKNDLIIDFSLSGEDDEINKILVKSKLNGVKIVGVCTLGNNTLSNISDIVIPVYNTWPERKKIKSRLMLHLASTLIIEKLIMSIE